MNGKSRQQLPGRRHHFLPGNFGRPIPLLGFRFSWFDAGCGCRPASTTTNSPDDRETNPVDFSSVSALLLWVSEQLKLGQRDCQASVFLWAVSLDLRVLRILFDFNFERRFLPDFQCVFRVQPRRFVRQKQVQIVTKANALTSVSERNSGTPTTRLVRVAA